MARQRSVIREVVVGPLDPRRLEPFIGKSRLVRLEETAQLVRHRLAGRRIVSVNSTAVGGGVAEMLQTLLGYVVGVGIDTRWLVVDGDPGFFEITKRIHNGLYGGAGDGKDLGPTERRAYERSIEANRADLLDAVGPGDVVIVHDPQPAGLIPALAGRDVAVVWRCHVGLDRQNEWSLRAWEFLRPYVEPADAYVFSRREFAPGWLRDGNLHVIPPSIDPLAPKNEELDGGRVASILAASGIVSAPGDAAPGRRARVLREGGPPGLDVPLVVQVSRWDRMKDMAGVLRGFVEAISSESGAQLVLAGPAVATVGDDPEDGAVWEQVAALWRSLGAADRARTHLVAVPMDDPRENALVVNALQRHAAVVVQKSVAEGFGLTVAEAMWKARPVVASAVGGIVDQVVDGESGLLLPDPSDLPTFGRLVARVLGSPEEAERLGANARLRVADLFLPDRQLLQYSVLLEHLLG